MVNTPAREGQGVLTQPQSPCDGRGLQWANPGVNPDVGSQPRHIIRKVNCAERHASVASRVFGEPIHVTRNVSARIRQKSEAMPK